MKMRVILDGPEVQNILLQHITKHFDSLKPQEKGYYIAASRVGECPPAFEAIVEVRLVGPDPRD